MRHAWWGYPHGFVKVPSWLCEGTLVLGGGTLVLGGVILMHGWATLMLGGGTLMDHVDHDMHQALHHS